MTRPACPVHLSSSTSQHANGAIKRSAIVSAHSRLSVESHTYWFGYEIEVRDLLLLSLYSILRTILRTREYIQQYNCLKENHVLP